MLLQASKGVQRIGHIALRVKNLDRAKSFYLNLGMQLIWDDADWCYLEAGKGKDGLALLGPSYKAAGPHFACLLYTSPSPRDLSTSRMPSSA